MKRDEIKLMAIEFRQRFRLGFRGEDFSKRVR